MNEDLTVVLDEDSRANVDPVTQADDLLRSGDREGSWMLLNELLSEVPDDWSPVKETDEFIQYCFWNQNEFQAFIDFYKETTDKLIFWTPTSYSKA